MWKEIPVTGGDLYQWNENSTYLHHPPYFAELIAVSSASVRISIDARVLGLFGNSITTDHISPAGKSQQTARLASICRTRGALHSISTHTVRGAAITM